MSTSTPEYVDFIKKFLVNRCIIEFINQFYENPEYSDKSELLFSIDDVNVWNEIFNQVYPLLNYYFMVVSESKRPILYEQKQLSIVFEEPTFQEYLDGLIQHNTKSSDLKKFNDNMKIKDFNEKLYSKYEVHTKKITLKNNLIYLVKLYLSNQTTQTTQTTETKQKKYLTPTEENDLDLMINAIPYFEYVSHKNESDETIEPIEIEGLKYIQKYMFGLVDNDFNNQ
jgi:hypothetical protein